MLGEPLTQELLAHRGPPRNEFLPIEHERLPATRHAGFPRDTVDGAVLAGQEVVSERFGHRESSHLRLPPLDGHGPMTLRFEAGATPLAAPRRGRARAVAGRRPAVRLVQSRPRAGPVAART